MVVSVNANASQMLAVQALHATNRAFSTVQLRVSTGLKVNGPQDSPAVFSVAQNLRGEIAGIGAIKTALSLGYATVSVAIDGDKAASDLVTEMKAKAVQASQSGLDAAAQAALTDDLTSPRSQITTVVNGADFNGKKLINAGATNFNVLSNARGSVITVSAKHIDISSLAIQTVSLADSAQAATALTAVS